MEAGALFLLFLILLVLIAAGALVYGLAWRLRGKKLHPSEDKLAESPDGENGRPQHLRVDSGEQSRTIPRS